MTLTTHFLKNLIRSNPEKYLLLHYLEKNGQTYLVEKDNPTVVIGRVSRTVLSDFNVQPGKAIRYFEFMDSEVFEHHRETK